MRNLFIMMLTVLLGAGHAVAKDDGGFGSSRFSAQVPLALGTEVPADALAAAPSSVSPADIEPAAGEEDITPAEEPIDGSVIQNEHQAETIIIQKDMSVR